MVKIGVDAMGGDYAPRNVVIGALEAKRLLPDSVQLYLLGDKDNIAGICTEEGIDLGNFIIVHCGQKVQMGEHPVKGYVKKPDSSVAVGFRMLASGELDALASAGNTGVMLVGCMQTLKTLPGIHRPCISIEVPQMDGGKMLLLDVGFNADCRADVLLQFAFLGSMYAKTMMGVENPRVALLNIGEEPDKGALVHKEAYELLSVAPNLNFIGNLEAKHLFEGGRADVLVTDGFSGNVCLKQAEAMYDVFSSQGIRNDYIERLNYEVYGGTPVLGVPAPVMIGHGSSSSKAITYMILETYKAHQNDLVKKFETTLRHNIF